MRIEDLVHFCAPARLIMGCGVRAQLPALLARLGHRQGVLVTDAFFTASTPWVDEYVSAARACGIETLVYAGGLPDPSTTLCDTATRQVREQLGNRQADHVVALGGGSNIDLAKALCLTLPHGRPIADYTGDLGGVRPLPLAALPTTSGTGSEATPGAILIDPDNATKIAIMDNSLRPAIAVVDPELSYTCPPRVTADAGIDAFTHAIESLLTLDSCRYPRDGHPDPGYSGRSSLTMLFARESLRLCQRYLERCYEDGGDREARAGMSYASVYAALSYGSAGLNAGHGIAYAVAGTTHRSHGSTNAVMLPYVLDALCETRSEEMREVADIMGLPAAPAASRIRQVPVAVRALVGRLGIATTLREFGVDRQAIPDLCRDALGVARLARAFPVADVPAAYSRIVQRAWEGRLQADEAGGRA